MATQVAVKTDGSKVVLYSPYHPQLPAKAKAIGGRWDGSRWAFDARDEERVRTLAREVYGTDGSPTRTVTVRKTYTGSDLSTQSVFEFGREILHRPGRDMAVRLGDGVIVTEGTLPSSGGSVRNPKVTDYGHGPVTVEIRDVPADLVTEDDSTTIVDAAEDRRAALEAEIAELDAKLAALRAELAAL